MFGTLRSLSLISGSVSVGLARPRTHQYGTVGQANGDTPGGGQSFMARDGQLESGLPPSARLNDIVGQVPARPDDD